MVQLAFVYHGVSVPAWKSSCSVVPSKSVRVNEPSCVSAMSSLKSPMMAYSVSSGLAFVSARMYSVIRRISKARHIRRGVLTVVAALWVENTWNGLSAPGTSMTACSGQRMNSAALVSTVVSLTLALCRIGYLLQTPTRMELSIPPPSDMA